MSSLQGTVACIYLEDIICIDEGSISEPNGADRFLTGPVMSTLTRRADRATRRSARRDDAQPLFPRGAAVAHGSSPRGGGPALYDIAGIALPGSALLFPARHAAMQHGCHYRISSRKRKRTRRRGSQSECLKAGGQAPTTPRQDANQLNDRAPPRHAVPPSVLPVRNARA